MESAAVTLRFILRTEKHPEGVSAGVRWQETEEKQDFVKFSNFINLKNQTETEFANDLQLYTKRGMRIQFQFVQKNGNQEVEYARDFFTVFQGTNMPVEICETERPPFDRQKCFLRFKMNYFTYFGQNLYIIGSCRELGFWDVKRALPLSHSGSINSSSIGQNQLFSDRRYNWQRDLQLDSFPPSIQYRYFCSDGNHVVFEPEMRVLSFDSAPGIIELNDIWRWKVMATALYSTQFFSTIFSRESTTKGALHQSLEQQKVKCFFKANVAGLGRDRTLRIVGSIPELGNWNETCGTDLLPMKRAVSAHSPESEGLGWFLEIDIPSARFPFEYKLIAPSKTKGPTLWEISDNRTASVSGSETKSAAFDSWYINFPDLTFHGSSVFFSFSSVRGQGPICTFSAISSIGQWASRCGFSHIQVSDLFDHRAMTTQKMDLPISGYALNPALLSLHEYGYVSGAEEIESLITDKLTFLGNKVFPSKIEELKTEVTDFMSENSFWLENYTKLCASAKAKGSAAKASSDVVVDQNFALFVGFVQYLCYKEVSDSISSCAEKHIAVGLDLPYALSEYSAEALFTPSLFMIDYKLGEPPSKHFPIGKVLSAYPFNIKNATKWFAQRIGIFGRLFSAIRLSSTINYFRQWIVPRSKCIRSVFGRYEPSMSISCAELETWGLWDIERYSRPFIHHQNLVELFGYDAQAVEDTFLQKMPDSSLTFKPSFIDEVSLTTAKLETQQSELRKKYLNQLLRLQGEVLLIRNGEGDFTPRPALNVAADESGGTSFSFSALPPYEQAALLRLHDEFTQNKQRCLWASNGRTVIAQIGSSTQALMLSDAAGHQGEVCDEVVQNLTIIPLRVQTEGKGGNLFDDVRSYPFFSLAAPAKNSSPPLSFLWDNGCIETRKLWEEELWESGQAPVSFSGNVAGTIMRQHCWSASMLAMFPLDTLIGSTNHIVHSDMCPYGALDLPGFLSDKNAEKEITDILEQTKRRN